MRRYGLCLCLCALLLTIWGCGNPSLTQGGSTDTGNTVVALAGTVKDGEGTPGGRADISVRRSDYLSPLPSLLKATRNILDTVTDENGGFRIDGLDSGSYRIEIRKGNDWATLYDAKAARADKPAELPIRTFGPTAKVTGRVDINPDALRAFVQVYGLERLVIVNTATGRFDLLVPGGKFTLRFVDPEGGASGIREKEISVAAGDSLDIGAVSLRDSTAPYPEWKYSRKLWLNTTPSGADVAQDVHDFPLLVRLDATMIDFSQAQPSGADLRFTKGDGRKPLAYEIERWDAAAKLAEIWVRVDTVRGNSAEKFIHMHWGNPAAKDSSDGAAVFDTSLGYAGVWHLKEGSNFAGFKGYVDATANHNLGSGVAIADTTVGLGAIGLGQRLSGSGAYIHIPDSPSLNLGTGDFSLTVWARPDSIFRSHQLVSKRITDGGDFEFQLEADGHVQNYVGDGTGFDVFPSRQAIKSHEWHLLAMSRVGTKTQFFLDGVADSSVVGLPYNLDNTSDLFIGHDAQNLPEDWLGCIDEVRLSHRAMPAEWLLLSYRSQIPGSKLLSLFHP